MIYFQTRYGEIYDCVDFYKQLAFDHPLLKNHSFHSQVHSFSVPKMMANDGSSSNSIKIGLKRGCPTGTVPIRRTTKEDLIRAKLHAEKYGSKLSSNLAKVQPAVVRTISDPNQKYDGAFSTISIYNPGLVHDHQYSSGQMTVKNGPDQIQVGWTVNPTLYGDNNTRLLTFWQASQTSCFNTRCPGFIIVNSKIPLGAIIVPVSKQGSGPKYGVNFRVWRDPKNGNWWHFLGPDWRTPIGFWPKRLFSGLAGRANYIDWGGEVLNLPGMRGPQMGSGIYPDVIENSKYVAFSFNMGITVEDDIQLDARGIETFSDDAAHYRVSDKGFFDGRFRHLAFWGGTDLVA
ncbi:DUF239 domain-containing protein/DUF4409 domain-containing protein [Cephalotus follicularis]|uniref:DUF239 domain-containing protein/DUF4409 domain-containing protein n=1 Tax=Cephalotus follicularis TaxID=3775 RepID=A0A1Q3BLM9_CEPFO|nr:DUF239 domain-containing protein/DUF4409 domain-containing protein [Cephalotus follicularis]